MQPSFSVLPVVLMLVCIVRTHQHAMDEGIDRTNDDGHLDRAKRWLNYPVNGGLLKMVFGFIVPIRFNHPLPRVIVNTYNLQANYRIPPDIIYPYSESVWKNRAIEGRPSAPDAWSRVNQSRRQLFDLLEQGMIRWGRNGRACLLRAVCEVAETPLKHNGLIGEIIDVIFTPTPSDSLDPDYLLAQSLGQQGHNCTELYVACPIGHGLFDSISYLTTIYPLPLQYS